MNKLHNGSPKSSGIIHEFTKFQVDSYKYFYKWETRYLVMTSRNVSVALLLPQNVMPTSWWKESTMSPTSPICYPHVLLLNYINMWRNLVCVFFFWCKFYKFTLQISNTTNVIANMQAQYWSQSYFFIFRFSNTTLLYNIFRQMRTAPVRVSVK